MVAETISTQVLTYKFRLLPSKGQHRRLRAALDHTRDLYNAALAERIDCYRKTGQARTRYDQNHALTELRADPEWATYPVSLQRWPLVQIDLAFKAFFRRVKARQNPGFPRFKGRVWFKTFGFDDTKGWRIANGRLVMKGIGAIRLHIHRPLSSEPTSCKVKREGRHWYALLTVETECAPAHDGPVVGLDLGLSSLATLSTGETIPNPRAYARAMRELRVRQRALARCKRGSNGRHKARERVAAVHAKARRTRDTHLHRISAALTRRYSLIAVEDLDIRAVVNIPEVRWPHARQMHDASWGKFLSMLDYKAAKAGGRIIRVDPRSTSQTCPACGAVAPKPLSARRHKCDCGTTLHRDVAAAQIILDRGVMLAGMLNVGQWPERASEKLV
jgi:putative transposase